MEEEWEKVVPHNPRSWRVVRPVWRSCVKKYGRGPERSREVPEGWKRADVDDVSGREGTWSVCKRGEVCPSIYVRISMVVGNKRGEVHTLYKRILRSAVPTHRIGTLSLGWKATVFTSPEAVFCVDMFASRKRSMESVPDGNTTLLFFLLSAAFKMPFVEVNKFLAFSFSSSSSGVSSSASMPAASRSSRFRFRARLAHEGSGLIRSNCARRRVS